MQSQIERLGERVEVAAGPTPEVEGDRDVYVFWFRMHVEINARPEFALLSNESLGVYVRLLAASANQVEHGVLELSREDIACTIRVPVSALEKALGELRSRQLVVTTEDVVAIVQRDRHYDLSWSNSPEGRRERKRRQRERERTGATPQGIDDDIELL